MKKSELETLIIDAIWDDANDSNDVKAARAIIARLEEEGLLSSTYLTKEKDGSFKINYGWEPE